MLDERCFDGVFHLVQVQLISADILRAIYLKKNITYLSIDCFHNAHLSIHPCLFMCPSGMFYVEGFPRWSYSEKFH